MVTSVNLIAGDDEAFPAQQFDDVARRNRTVELSGFAGRADRNKSHAVDFRRDRFSFRPALQIASFQVSALVFEALEVSIVGAQRLALRQQEIARETVLNADRIAHLAKFGDSFEKYDFHLGVLSFPCLSRSWEKGRTVYP
jgi:hypothetical protein